MTEKRESVQKTLGDAAVGVNATVAEEGPVLARSFDFGGVEVCVENFFLVVRGLNEDAAEGIGDEAAAPELKA